MRVLIVEDKVKMASLLRRGLRGEGMAADVTARGEDALWMAGATRYDVVVLDLMLPGIDGVETCRRLRAAGVWTPVLMLTARGALEDRVAGLDGGADDYLTKPFALLEAFMRQPGVTLSRFDLLEAAWDQAYENRSNVVDQHVSALRERIDVPFGTRSIQTIRGEGYRLREDGER